jgi:hypothetical protein
MGNETALYETNKFRCEFYVQYFDKFKSFYGVVPVVPRVGDEMQLQFLRPIFNIEIFYVEKINHVLHDECQVIEVWLKAGSENTYERFYLTRLSMKEGTIISGVKLSTSEYRPLIKCNEQRLNFRINCFNHV